MRTRTHTHTAHWITLAVTLTPSDTFEREHCKGFDICYTLMHETNNVCRIKGTILI